jgi:hypothetical protein
MQFVQVVKLLISTGSISKNVLTSNNILCSLLNLARVSNLMKVS